MAGGRPTAYRPEYAEQLIEYFSVKPCAFEERENSKGEIQRITIPASLPTMAGFACKIGVHRETILNWSKNHPEFFDALKLAKEYQEHILIENGLMGGYDKTFAIFTAKNLINWRDKTEVDSHHSGHLSVSDLTDDELRSRIKQFLPASTG
jgi:hypothetical protein